MKNKTKNPTVQSVRDSGLKVKVNHFRHTKRGAIIKSVKNDNKGIEFAPKGGFTVVVVTDKELNTEIGVSHCIEGDNFCYEMGVKISLGRAMKEYKAHNSKSLQQKSDKMVNDIIEGTKKAFQ